MAEIQVTSWGTREPLPNDPGAPMHDCLWEIAQEQAVLARMKQTGENWQTAGSKVSQQDIRKHLDFVCEDNNFRHLDGSGSGRDPNLIFDGERIKVRIDPTQLDKPADGVDAKPTQDAYSKAVTADSGQGVDINKKTALDKWLESVPGFPKLSDGSKAALINAYGKPGMNRENLARLGGSAAFSRLDEKQQQQLLEVYGAEGKGFATGEVDNIAASADRPENDRRLKLVGSHGFFKMDEGAQRLVLDRYTNDTQFRDAVDRIVVQPNFTNRNSTEQAHALDILGRYSKRDGEGYGQVPEDKRTLVLVGLYDEVLSKPEFNLNHIERDKKENDAQRTAIDKFANDRASQIAGTEPKPEPTPTKPEIQSHTD